MLEKSIAGLMCLSALAVAPQLMALESDMDALQTGQSNAYEFIKSCVMTDIIHKKYSADALVSSEDKVSLMTENTSSISSGHFVVNGKKQFLHCKNAVPVVKDYLPKTNYELERALYLMNGQYDELVKLQSQAT